MTGKERAQLRAQANSLEPLFQIGKGGMSEALVAQMKEAGMNNIDGFDAIAHQLYTNGTLIFD